LLFWQITLKDPRAWGLELGINHHAHHYDGIVMVHDDTTRKVSRGCPDPQINVQASKMRPRFQFQ